MSEQLGLIDGVDPSARREFDYYPTPEWMTLALLRRVGHPWNVIEPCAGQLAIVTVLKRQLPHVGFVESNDLAPGMPTDTHDDATRPTYWEALRNRDMRARPVWGITNVPFDLADEIVPLAVASLPYFATILRLSWLEPTAARQRFLAANPPRTVIVMPRYDFKGRGQTDSVTSAWFVWEDGRSSVTKGIQIVTKDERDELIAQSERRAR